MNQADSNNHQAQAGGKNLDDLRGVLFATLEGLKAGTMDLDRARVINEVGKTLVDTAKVEVQFLQVTGGDESTFIDTKPKTPEALPNGITGVTRHVLR